MTKCCRFEAKCDPKWWKFHKLYWLSGANRMMRFVARPRMDTEGMTLDQHYQDFVMYAFKFSKCLMNYTIHTIIFDVSNQPFLRLIIPNHQNSMNVETIWQAHVFQWNGVVGIQLVDQTYWDGRFQVRVSTNLIPHLFFSSGKRFSSENLWFWILMRNFVILPSKTVISYPNRCTTRGRWLFSCRSCFTNTR